MTVSRRHILQGSAIAAASSMLPSFAFAKAPLNVSQAPSFYRLKVGTIEVTAVTDGLLNLPILLFPTADNAEAKALLSKAHRAEAAQTAINTYVINTGDKLILVDTGYGALGGPGGGLLLENLKAAGFAPEQIDAVLLTHMHPDHVGGLAVHPDRNGRLVAGAGGQPAFPNATLLVGETEYKFWTDEATMSRAPADAQQFFKIAQDKVKPYAKAMQLLANGAEIASGLTLSAAPGHTPGHSTVTVSSGRDTLLIWGDIVHVAALQFPRPEWAISFDTDQAVAIATRKAMFDKVSADGTMIAGMHLDFPGLGYVSRDGGAYRFERAVWSPKL